VDIVFVQTEERKREGEDKEGSSIFWTVRHISYKNSKREFIHHFNLISIDIP